MFGKTTQRLFGALVIVSLVLTSVGATRGAAARQTTVPPASAAEAHVAVGAASPQAATPIDPSPYGQYSPRVAGDSAGNLFALWMDMREGDGNPHVRFAYRPAGGAWQPSSKLDPAGARQYRTALAVDGSGNAYAAYTDRRGGYDQVYFAIRPAGGAWSAGQVISPTVASQPQDAPALAVNRRGDVLVAWAQGRAGVGSNVIYAATRPAGGAWGAAQPIGQARGWGSYLNAALDDWGQAYALWLDPTGKQVSFATRPPSAAWSAAQNVCDSAAGNAISLSLAVDSAGNAHAVWSDARNGRRDVYAAYRPAGGPWSANVRVTDNPVSPAGDVSQLALSVDGAGNAYAVWGDYRAGSAVYTAMRYRGGGWGPNQPLVTWPPTAGRVASPASSLPQQESVNFSPFIAAFWAEIINLLYTVPVGATDVYNVYFQDLPAGGSSGQCGPDGDNPCHAGNAAEAPAQNSDQGAYPPNAAGGQVVSYPVTQMKADDGTTIYVVKVPGHMGIFTDPGAAEQFAQQQALAAIAQPAPQPPAEPPAQPTAQPAAQPTAQPAAKSPEEMAPGEIIVTYGEDQSPPLTPKLQAWMDASWLVHMSEDRPLTSDEQNQLAAALAVLGPDDPNLPKLIYDYQQNVAAQQAAQQTQQTNPTGQTPAGQPTPAPSGKQKPDPTVQYYQNQYGTSPLKNIINWLTGGKSTTEPVLPHSGEFVYNQTPLHIPGRGLDYMFHLSYRSQLVYNGPAGWGWTHNYDRRVVATGGGSLGLQDGAGLAGVFSFDGATFTPSAGRFTAVISTTTGITITDRSGLVEGYFPLDGSAAAGRLRSISDPNGNTLRFAYDGQRRLQTVTDTLGRNIVYSYDANNRIATVTDFSGRAVRLAYDGNGDLVGITTPAVTGTPNGNDFPAGKTTRFAYTTGFSDQRLNHNLTTVISPNEVADGSLIPREINTYGTSGLAFDRVVSQSWGGGRANASGIPAGGEVALAYSTAIEPTAPPGAFSKTTITDRGGNVLELWHDGAGHRLRDRQVVNGQALVTDYAYNSDGLMTRLTYPAGNRIEYRYDDGATNRLAQGNLLEQRRVADATRGCSFAVASSVIARSVLSEARCCLAGAVEGCSEAIPGMAGGDCFAESARNDSDAPCPALVTTYTYEPVFQKVKTITDPRGATTTYGYDARGNLTQVRFPTVTLGVTTPQAASESWTYNPFGQPLTFTDPEGKFTAYEYYTSGPMTGYRQRVIRDSGGQNVATAYTYDAVGNVTSVTDPRGIRTDYTVNALNQVVKAVRAVAVSGGQEAGVRDQGAEGSTPFAIRHSPFTALDYETLYTYDANDNLARVDVENVLPDLDANFHPTGSYSRDAANPWWTTTYTYDLLDNLVRASREVSPTSQAVTGYRYDPLERLTALTLPAGNRIEYGYDGRNRLQQLTQGAGTAQAATTSYAYDANGNRTRMTDGEGHLTDAIYDGFDRPAGQIDALGNVRAWRYDANGNLVETLARDGQDGRNPGRALNAAGLVTLSRAQNAYDERNRRYAAQRAYFTADVGTGTITPITTDGDGDGWVETAYTYDRNSNLTALTDDRGATTRYAYDGLNRLALRADALNNTAAYSYDGNNNLVQTVATERQPNGLAPAETFTTTYAYDAANRLVSTTDNLNQTTRSAYDSRGNQVFRSDANGAVTAIGESAIGNPQSPIPGNAHGNTAFFSYDGLNRLLSETYHLRAGGVGSGAVTGQVVMSYTYDANGNRVRQTDPNGHATAYAYDALDRLVRTTYADSTVLTYAYDRAGNLTRQTDANGSVIAHTYDAADRRVRTDVTRGAGVGGATLQTFAWDGLARLIAASDNNDPATAADDSALGFAYDSLGNTRRETQDGRTVISAYDGLGNRLTLTYPGGTALTYTYDALNRMKTVADAGGSIAAYDYFGPDRLWRRTFGNNTYAVYSYDGDRRLTGLAYRRASDDALLTGFAYTYDRADNRLSETAQPGNRQTAYSYDSLYRLTSAQSPISNTQYQYDPAGNRTQVVRNGQTAPYTANALNEYLAVGSETRAYDAVGNLRQVYRRASSGHRLYLPLLLKRPAAAAAAVAADITADRLAATETLTETLISYRYDFRDRLIGLTRTVTVTSGAGAQVTTTVASFTYDAFDRQARTVAPAGERRFIYAVGRAIEERDAAGALVASYVGLLTMDRGGARTFYQTDGIASVRGLADAAGATVERVEYDPFGAPVFSSGGQESARGNPYLFRGLRYDADNAVYVTGSRRYEPATGRTFQRGPEALGNPYTFAGNNPMG